VVQGNSVAIPITVTSINGFAGTIAFECNGIPNSSTCSFSQGSATLALELEWPRLASWVYLSGGVGLRERDSAPTS
jgi:hypothetical protein